MSGGHDVSKSESRPLNAKERANIFNSQLGLIGSALGQYNPIQGGGYASTGASAYSASGGGRDFSASEGFDPFTMGFAGIGQNSLFGDQIVAGRGMGKSNPYQSMFGLVAPEYVSPGYAETGDAHTMTGGDYDRLEQSIVDSRWAPLQRYETQIRQQTDEDLNKRGIYSSGVATQAQGDVTEQFLPQYTAAGAEAATQRYGMQNAENAMLNEMAMQDASQRNAFNLEQASRNYASSWAPLEYLASLYNQTGGTVSASNSYSQNLGF